MLDSILKLLSWFTDLVGTRTQRRRKASIEWLRAAERRRERRKQVLDGETNSPSKDK